MIGNPRYDYGDKVKFSVFDENKKEHELVGEIYIIDAYGTFEQNEEVSYDIMVEESPFGNPCLFKHITEPGVLPAN